MQQSVMWVGVLALAVLTDFAVGSPYDQLGLQMNATEADILTAYEQHFSTWPADTLYNQSEIKRIIQIEHAYQLLSNNLTRRDYDYFNIDDLEEDVLQAIQKYEGEAQRDDIQFPLWESRISGDKIVATAESLTYSNFGDLVMMSSQPWLIQIYSDVNPNSKRFASIWDKIEESLEGVVRVGRLELGELPLALILAERNWLNGYPFFRNGLPAIVAVMPSCQKLECLNRYYGEKTADAITDWVGTRLLKLPRIMYYSVKTLMADIIQKPGPHKVKVIAFSYSGERAAPYMRQAAKVYREYAVFAMVLWRESEGDFWRKEIGVETAPALVFIKDPDLKPVVHHGKLNSSKFLELMEMHKTYELPQLRSITARSLGCDASSYSLAGNETRIWYCVIVAGKQSSKLDQMRSALRGVQEQLKLGEDRESTSKIAIKAYQENRLRLAWLDGEIQKNFCYFYLNSESMFEACGPQNYEIENRPRVFLIRYLREVTEEKGEDEHKKWLPKTTWQRQSEEEMKFARQLVTKYNGSSEVAEIISWISNMVYQGDTEELPSFASPATASSEVAEVGVDKKDELQATPQRNPTEMSNFEKSVGMSDGLRRRNEPAQRSTVK
ncbi:hypothetical protein MPTK1_2g06970 [Marchantia polymorpha subsp. ruderalis]|uniref:J domain-containing protein n=1 Tax=Marchantia polymorpha TaxID=3197 RepID=A0A2R6XDY3_MARPO|nr:hypothetical protein MARPO_0021s0150 [Marchantia polymorpha]BBN01378.1 hypothetical protein Mp_2g06970 [Marchantia polymorpha subsp. ruderalis]|eukprot:PTQ44303.1 hypothetical protein MARPO_0021s0150 [Marchantia polymorpha]